jgi:acetylglutamate kinase
MGEVAALLARGLRFVLCHGGNPQANALTEGLGLPRTQIGGRRVTDAATLKVMKQVLAGECNVDVVAAAAAKGISAVGISAVSAGLVEAVRRPPRVISGCGPDPVDFGFVGDITAVHPALIEQLWAAGHTPVLNTLAIAAAGPADEPRAVFNVNADTVASAVAAALSADHLFLMTDVPGVLADRHDPASRIPRLTADEAQRAIASEVIVGGMIPKVEEALKWLADGVGAIHILGADNGALTAEATMPGSRGTVLVTR